MTLLASKARILIVEDEVLIAEEIAERLSRLDYEVVARATTAEDAVKEAVRLSPDLVLMDIRLKGSGDGIEAAERIMSAARTPIVYLTAHSDNATVQRAKHSKPFGFVLKPFQQKDLVIAIEMALERHAAEQRLYESEQRYSTTLRSIGDGVIATDSERRVTFMNPKAEKLTGWSFGEASGQPVSTVLRFDGDEASLPRPIEDALEQGSTVYLRSTVDLRSRDGGVTPVEDSASPILGAQGELLGAVMAFYDCSERIASEQALQEVERRLEESRRREALSRLAGGVAHDFNNVLTIVIGSGELLRHEIAKNPRASALLDSILKAAERATNLTGQLVAYGRQSLVQPRVIELNNLLADLEETVAQVAGPEIEVHVDLEGQPMHIRVEPSQFEQAVINMASNARDAMAGKTTGRLWIETRLVPDPEDPTSRHQVARMRVRDEGAGMDEETISRVFEPFFTTKPVGEGTGLGLATVFGVVLQAQGEIQVTSQLGEGTTFTMHLPIVDAEASGPEPALGGEARGTETILLVEDDEAVRHLTTASLELYGYHVTCAENGPRALEAYDAAEGIDVVVTDLMLPGWSGLEIARRLHAKNPDLPVLYISGHTEEEIARQGAGNPRVQLLRKPFTPQALARKLRQLLDG